MFWLYTCPGKFTSARKTEHFIGLFMTAVDRIKCRYAHSGMTSGVGGFQNPGVCLQAFPSFLPHPLPAYSRHFSRGLYSETARKRLLRRLARRRPYRILHEADSITEAEWPSSTARSTSSVRYKPSCKGQRNCRENRYIQLRLRLGLSSLPPVAVFAEGDMGICGVDVFLMR